MVRGGDNGENFTRFEKSTFSAGVSGTMQTELRLCERLCERIKT
jgi:hypothetical protein